MDGERLNVFFTCFLKLGVLLGHSLKSAETSGVAWLVSRAVLHVRDQVFLSSVLAFLTCNQAPR